MVRLHVVTCVLAVSTLLGSGARYRRQARKSLFGQANIFQALSTAEPSPDLFPPRNRAVLPPYFTAVAGPKNTNKFWGNWLVEPGATDAIFCLPWALKWSNPDQGISNQLQISNQNPEFMNNYRIQETPVIWDFAIGVVEKMAGKHSIVKEDLFGVHVDVYGPSGTSRKITYPIFNGMTYITARTTGGLTPRAIAAESMREVSKVRAGVWKVVNSRGRQFRVYALTPAGKPVDNSFKLDNSGTMNKQLDGWFRLAAVNNNSDTVVLDAHAGAVVMGCDLSADGNGVVQYSWVKNGSANTEVLHYAFAHHVKVMSAGALKADMGKIQAPTKGKMTPMVGDVWKMQLDVTAAKNMGLLPAGEPAAQYVDEIKAATLAQLADFKHSWRYSLFKWDYYFSGKGYQKVGTICLLAAKYLGKGHPDVQGCADNLHQGFKCLYEPEKHQGACNGAPVGSYYDQEWGGIPSRNGFYDLNGCSGQTDFGNACYNDHHYHYGYFVVAGAQLLELQPELKSNTAFTSYVDMLIRDTTNPSSADTYFPRFRSFDWFDFHSWSRGLFPSHVGKDQESTSEEVNLQWGMVLWGKATGRQWVKDLGATMLSMSALSIKEYFLMKNDNPNHEPGFAKNHVTGIFFQNQVRYDTWFGSDLRFIHGIQMLPLTPALQLTRDAEFARQEWYDRLSDKAYDRNNAWSSVLLTGGLAMFKPAEAYSRVAALNTIDDGLTRAYALYWTAVQPCDSDCGEPIQPAPAPAPAPPAPPAGGGGGGSGIFCNPNLNQMCPGQIPCPQCGAGACECPR